MGQIAGNQYNPDRVPFDDYPTDPLWTSALLDRVKFRGPIWEPAAGDGRMVEVLVDYGYEVRSTDIRKTGDDFLQATDDWSGSIITNPPYRHADGFLSKALCLASDQVAMLLPINALGGKKRSSWLWYKRPPALVYIVPRYQNVVDRTSQFYHVWCVWDAHHDGPTEFDWAPMPETYTRLRHPTELAKITGYQR